MKIGTKEFNLGERTFIMGILNVTPDSFSDGGKFNTLAKALEQVNKLVEEGVDIIDIGGESTRPGFLYVEEDDEIARVVPVIKAIKEKYDIAISIDTYKAKVAEEAVKAGADLINDVWGFKKDLNMAKVAAKYNVPCCLMHNKSEKEYDNIIEDMHHELQESINIALEAGVKKENIILDPGIGFGKTYEHNIEVMHNLEKFLDLGYPMLLATSRKSMIGLTLDLPTEERVEGTIATTVVGIMKGYDFVRVHDVKENKRAAQMTDAIIRRKR
ncbi:dihydropteroate synthase [Clostridium intestinale]|uniref:dihydropteroate synthase n=1 Tax=Clostridium intestinale TaxID=36845 RepID=UPI002DD6240D|nr:dihydropteroate synthase [Clostridium intestinale]WRY51965.1 dihydropteroate synthase [Clostridium intestinale]